MNNRSHTARAEFVGTARRLLDRCQQIDPAHAQGFKRSTLLSLRYWLDAKVRASKFPTWDDSNGISPYVLSQLTGAYATIPDFLGNLHPVRQQADVEAFVDRLHAFASAIDQDTDRQRVDAGHGVLAPNFVLGRAVDQLLKLRAVQASDRSSLAATLASQSRTANIPRDSGPEAQRILIEEVIPAIDRQLAVLGELRPLATHEAGVWRLPDGPDFYIEALRQNITTNQMPNELHKLGLDLQEEWSAKIDQTLRKVGLTNGTVGERLRDLNTLYDDPVLRYPKTNEGKEELKRDADKLIAAVEALLSGAFGTLPKADVDVKFVSDYLQAGAPGGQYQHGTIDRSRHGIYYLNPLHPPARWTLPTLTFHEAKPGHHLQQTLELENKDLPLVQQALMAAGGFNAYAEGWALYAEELADERGFYERDPLGKIGFQHDALFRAVRLVIDTGLHHLRWSREQALRHYMDVLGDKEDDAAEEIDRYCVWPGQACGYMIGKNVFLELKDRAKMTLGPKFDPKAFHDAALLGGAMPLEVLRGEIDSYISENSGVPTP